MGQCKLVNRGIPKDLGHFHSEIEAFHVYKKEKENRLKLKANKFKNKITKKCFESLNNWSIEIED